MYSSLFWLSISLLSLSAIAYFYMPKKTLFRWFIIYSCAYAEIIICSILIIRLIIESLAPIIISNDRSDVIIVMIIIILLDIGLTFTLVRNACTAKITMIMEIHSAKTEDKLIVSYFFQCLYYLFIFITVMVNICLIILATICLLRIYQ